MEVEKLVKFKTLSDQQIEQLHFATRETLDRVGVRVLHGEALNLLKEAGCVKKKDGIVMIPPIIFFNLLRSGVN